MVDTEANESRKQGRKKLVSTMWTLDELESDFRDGYDEYLARSPANGNPEARGGFTSGANDPQPNNGGRAREELSKLVSDGVGQAPGGSTQEVIGRVECLQK